MGKKGGIILWAVVLIAVLVAAYTAIYSNRNARQERPGVQVGERSTSGNMAQDFTLMDLKGKNVKLSDYRGKVVFLNFWASWCPPCRAEMPDINRMNEEFSKGSDAVIVSVDEGESADTVRNFLTSSKYSLNPLLDLNGKVGNAYNVTGIPTTFVIDKGGKVYDSIVGPITGDRMREYVNKLK